MVTVPERPADHARFCGEKPPEPAFRYLPCEHLSDFAGVQRRSALPVTVTVIPVCSSLIRASTAAAALAILSPLTCASVVQVLSLMVCSLHSTKVMPSNKLSSLGAGTAGDGAVTGSGSGVATKPPPDKSQEETSNRHAAPNRRRTGFFEALLILSTVQAVQR